MRHGGAMLREYALSTDASGDLLHLGLCLTFDLGAFIGSTQFRALVIGGDAHAGMIEIARLITDSERIAIITDIFALGRQDDEVAWRVSIARVGVGNNISDRVRISAVSLTLTDPPRISGRCEW